MALLPVILNVSIAGHTGHVTRSGNRACFVPRVNSFAIKSFFYTGIKQWNALPSTTQLLTNKQAFKSEVKKLLWMKLIQMDEEVYIFFIKFLSIILFYIIIFSLILHLFCTFAQLYSDLTILTLHATTYLICDIKP